MVTRVRGVAASLVAVGILVPCAAGASNWPVPSRPLTPAEVQGNSVHRAERVLVGDIVSWRLTDVDSVEGLIGYLPYHVGIRPRRWLEGNEGPGTFTVCWWPPHDQRPIPVWGGGSPRFPLHGSFVVFARRPTGGSPAADSCAWFAIPDYRPWTLPAFSPWTERLEGEVRSAVQRQEPAELALRSHRVVLGTLEREPSRKAGQAPTPFVRVSRSLKGGKAPGKIPIRWMDDGSIAWNTKARHLVFLRQAPGGVVEPVELGAGVVSVVGDSVPAWSMTLEDAIELIEAKPPGGQARP
jgi:hypothetical protein